MNLRKYQKKDNKLRSFDKSSIEMLGLANPDLEWFLSLEESQPCDVHGDEAELD